MKLRQENSQLEKEQNEIKGMIRKNYEEID